MPISITRSIRSGLPHCTQASPAAAVWISANSASLKCLSALTPFTWIAFLVRACHIHALLERRIGDLPDLVAHGADEPRRHAEGRLYLVLLRRTVRADKLCQLLFMQGLVAAHQGEHRPCVAHDQNGLDQEVGRDLQEPRHLLDGPPLRRGYLLDTAQSGKFGVFGTDTASSTFAAYPQPSQSATSSSPAGDGAMNSWAMVPPIMPVSLWTT